MSAACRVRPWPASSSLPLLPVHQDDDILHRETRVGERRQGLPLACTRGDEVVEHDRGFPGLEDTLDELLRPVLLGLPARVDERTKGDGKWGQTDLAGNVWEWTLDWYDTYQMPCDNCADITDTSGSSRVVRGGFFDSGVA